MYLAATAELSIRLKALASTHDILFETRESLQHSFMKLGLSHPWTTLQQSARPS